MQQLREETEKADADKKKKILEEVNPGYGYGGKFGLEVCFDIMHYKFICVHVYVFYIFSLTGWISLQ